MCVCDCVCVCVCDCVCVCVCVVQAVNIGEVLDTWVPEELSDEEKVEGRWWRQLLAGGGAGAGEPHPLIVCHWVCECCVCVCLYLQCPGHVQLLWTDSRYSFR